MSDGEKLPEQKIIDMDFAKAVMGGKEAIVIELLQLMLDSFPQEFEKLKAAYHTGAWSPIQDIAHKMKGGASYCGALRLREACTRLEKAIQSNQKKTFDALYERLLTEMHAVETEAHTRKW